MLTTGLGIPCIVPGSSDLRPSSRVLDHHSDLTDASLRLERFYYPSAFCLKPWALSGSIFPGPGPPLFPLLKKKDSLSLDLVLGLSLGVVDG